MKTSTTAVAREDVRLVAPQIDVSWPSTPSAWRVTSLRLFRGHVHRLLALAGIELAVVVG